MYNENFYSKIKPIPDFKDISNLNFYQDVPADWLIILTDVVMSTKAIESGKYKDVNSVGALTIAAVLNIIPDHEIPFVFGGDGSTLLIPKKYLNEVKDTLIDTQQRSIDNFGLKLRVGVVPVEKIYHDGHKIKIAKLKVSDTYNQSILLGSGIDFAEKLIKDPKTSPFFAVGKNIARKKANYSGFTCRWQDVPSQHGEIVSLIIKSKHLEIETQAKHYGEIISIIYDIYGENWHHHPLHSGGLNLSFDFDRINFESKIYTENFLAKTFRLGRIYAENLIGMISDYKQKPVNSFSAEKHKHKMILSSDHKKFDGSLKMIISGNSNQRFTLENKLNQLSQDSPGLAFGLHVTDRALLTCLVFSGTDREVHFVDGADGGYALAAKELKKKLLG